MVGVKPISEDSPLVLASASPRRRALLRGAGLPISVRPVAVDESLRPGETPRSAVGRLASSKARACWLEGSWVLAADTVVVVDEHILGKPEGPAAAEAMLRSLSGREHTVATGFALLDPSGALARAEVVETRVRFRALDEGTVKAYVASGEPFGKAGSYAIQGIAAALVQEIHGSYSNVVGLPLCEVLSALEQVGAIIESPLARGRAALEDRSE